MIKIGYAMSVLRKSRRHMKGVSPIIATVIISSISIAIAVGTAYWISGLIPTFARREEARVMSCYIQNSTSAVINIKNTGSTDITVDFVQVNGRLVNPDEPLSVVIKQGETTNVEVNLTSGDSVERFISGVRYDFTVHTTTGLNFPASARAF